ncbi:MAG TPA: hypothetical protein PKC58_11510 [Ignavibacteria bacterium]|nr:hypothetical protein [Ignavibacteria bacterium]
MHKSSLLGIIRTFTPKELIKFEDFVNSPYFNKNKNVINLFAEVKKHAPEYTGEMLDKERVWEKIFPGKEYNYGIMKNIIHDLSVLCESFLSEEIYSKKESRRSIDLLESILKRDLKRNFENSYDAIARTFKKNFDRKNINFSDEYYSHQKKITDLYEGFLHLYDPQLKNKITIIPSCEYLIYAFLIESIKMFQKVIGHSLQYNHPLNENILYNVFKKLDEGSMITDIIEYSEKQPGKDHLVLKCYYSMFRALRLNDNFDNFKEFKNNISKVNDILPESEISFLYYALMTCLTNLKITLNNFGKEYFDIIKICHKRNFLLNEDGSISPHFFFSIVNMACSEKELAFAEKFISEYTPKIPADFRESHFNYAMSKMNFLKGNFETSLEYLSKIQNEDKSMKYYMKNDQITVYYELNDRESFEYAYDTLKHFIRKNRLTNESRILTLTNYCGYIKAMFKLREKFDSYEYDTLKKKIELTKTTNKGWLIRKLEEIKADNQN